LAAPLDGSAPARVLHQLLDFRFELSSPLWARNDLALFQETSPTPPGLPGPDRHLLRVPADGSLAAERLSRFRVTAGDVRSFDLVGSRVLYVANEEAVGREDIYLTSPTGAAAPRRWSDPADTWYVGHASFSPDGQRVAAQVWSLQSGLSLFVGPADASALPVSLGNVWHHFDWTPDSRRLIFPRFNASGQVELLSAKSDGLSAPVVVNDPLVAGGSPQTYLDFRASADSRWVVYLADQDVDERVELYRAEADGSGGSVALGGVQGEEDVLTFRLSNDSRWAVFLVFDATIQSSSLYSVNLTGPAVRTLLTSGPSIRPSTQFEIGPNSDRVVFHDLAGFRGGVSELFSVPIVGGLPLRLSSVSSRVSHLAFAVNGTRVVYQTYLAVQSDSTALYSAPLDGSSAPLLMSPTPFSPFDYQACFLVDPSGGKAAYIGVDGLVNVDLLDANTIALDPAANRQAATWMRYSPDGSQLVYTRFLGDGFELAFVETDGSRPPRSVTGPMVAGGSVFTPIPYAFTPDGKRVVYVADQEENETRELFSARVAGPRTLPE
jgi:Tol biopolymer transport system component